MACALVLVWGAAGSRAHAEQEACPVAIDAPPDAAAVVREAITTQTTEEIRCRPLSVRLRQDRRSWIVERIEDGRRVERRTVSDLDTASALVASWAREAWFAPPSASSEPSSSTTASSSAVSSPPAPSASAALVVPAAAASPRATPPADPPPSSSPGSQPGVALSARLGLSLASDASLWADATLGGCGFVGPVCLGAAVRAPFDVLANGPGKDLATSRGGLDGLVTAELPFVWDRIAFRPALALGGGWLRASATSPSGDFVERDAGVLRLSAFARLGVRLTGALWLELGALSDLAPLSPSAPLLEGGATIAGFPLFRAGVDTSLRVEL